MIIYVILYSNDEGNFETFVDAYQLRSKAERVMAAFQKEERITPGETTGYQIKEVKVK